MSCIAGGEAFVREYLSLPEKERRQFLEWFREHVSSCSGVSIPEYIQKPEPDFRQITP